MENAEMVARAALWLDTVRPGWANEVNLDTLCMHHSDSCISGQVFGYDTWENTARRFNASNPIGLNNAKDVFAQFEQEWIEQIRLRLPFRNLSAIADAVRDGETSGEGWTLTFS